jgi:hypothetical protein
MRSAIAIGALAIAVTMMLGGTPLAHGAPACDGGCTVNGAGGGSNNHGGSHGVLPTTSIVKPPPAVFHAQTVVETAPPPPPPPAPKIPPPAIAVHQPVTENVPVDTPPPAVVPVEAIPVPVIDAPAPADVPPLPVLPPAAPPVPVPTPVSHVLFTSSAEPGTQALTLIVLFMACGCWIYGNRIGSQMTGRRSERAAAGA